MLLLVVQGLFLFALQYCINSTQQQRKTPLRLKATIGVLILADDSLQSTWEREHYYYFSIRNPSPEVPIHYIPVFFIAFCVESNILRDGYSQIASTLMLLPYGFMKEICLAITTPRVIIIAVVFFAVDLR
jgi:hypothetical protein